MPISPDSAYVLDGMFRALDITGDVHSFAYLTGFDMDGLVDLFDETDARAAGLDVAGVLIAACDGWYAESGPLERAHVGFAGLLSAKPQLVATINTVLDVLSVNGVGTVDRRQVDAALRTEPRHERWVDAFAPRLARWLRDASAVGIEDYADWDRRRRAGGWRQVGDPIRRLESGGRVFEAAGAPPAVAARLEDILDAAPRRAAPPAGPDPKRLRAARKAMKKGVSLFSKLFGKRDIQLFLSGDGFTVEGEKFNWLVRRSPSVDLVAHTADPHVYHIPYSLQILTKDNVVLGDCCVYFDGTPVVDQLIALVLHVKNGNEEEVVRTMNVTGKRPAYCQHDELLRIRGEHWEHDPSQVLRQAHQLFQLDFLEEMGLRMDRETERLMPGIEAALADRIGIARDGLRWLLDPPLQLDELHLLGARAAPALARLLPAPAAA